LLVVYGDGTVCFTTGDVTKLLEDAQLIKPHLMAGVPRVYNRYMSNIYADLRIHAAIKAQMDAPGLKGALVRKAVETKLANWRATGTVKHALYDALVFRKVFQLDF
jgi:long-chain acyl-CoA synthetase